MRIRIRQVGDKFEAYMNTRGERVSGGICRSREEAVGSLILFHAEKLSVQILDENGVPSKETS
jgi:hypothetical protein